MKFCQNKIDAINDILKYKKDINQKEYLNFYYSFLLYRNKWKNISKDSITNKTDLYKGYLFNEGTTIIDSIDKYTWSNDVIELENESNKILCDLIKYIKENDINVLFVIPKRIFEEGKIER